MKTFQAFIFIIFLVLKVKPLGACLSICGSACFASLTKAICMAFCMGACAAGTKNCFSVDTTIQVQKNDTIIELPISRVKENDKVLTLKNGNFELTNVVQILNKKGNYTFYELKARNTKGNIKTIKLTENHGVIIIKNNEKYIIQAKNIKEGNLVLTNEGIFMIYSVSKLIQNEKYTLYTKDGTVLASNIFVSTICEPDINESISYEKLMKSWRKAHKIINNYVNY